MIYNYVSKSSPISPLPFRREKEHTSFRIINVSFFQSPGKGSTTALQRFADGECPRPRFVPLPSRLALSPSPLRKKERKAASFSYRAAFLPFFVGGLATFTIIPYEYIHAHTHIFILTHARRFERELVSEGGPTFLRLHRVNRGGGGGGKRPLRSLSKGVASLSDGSLPVEVTRKGRDATHFVFNHSDG